jgi:hypothetical protein
MQSSIDMAARLVAVLLAANDSETRSEYCWALLVFVELGEERTDHVHR